MMNTRSTSMMTIAVALGVVCFGLSNPGHVDAVPSQMSHEMSGTVQRIDRQMLSVVPTGASKPEAFASNSKDTKFFCDGAPTTVESLRGHLRANPWQPSFARLWASSLPRFLANGHLP